MAPRWSQNGAKRAPKRAQTSQDGAQIGHLEPPRKTLKKGPWIRPVLDPKMAPNVVQKLLRIGSVLGPISGSLLEQFWEAVWVQDRPRRRQEEPKRANQGSMKRKRRFSKKGFSHRTVCIFSLLRPPKELLNPKKKGSKIDPKINKFWTNFGFQNGSQKYPRKILQEEPKN